MKYDQVLPKKLTIDGIDILGTTLAGIGTCLTLPQFKLCFDVAQGLPFAFSAKSYFITHAHMDHASGIPYVISQRAVQGLTPANFYMPKGIVEPLKDIMKTWSKIENHTYDFNFIGMDEDSVVKINNSFFVKAFNSHHRVESLGYTLFERKQKLKAEYRGLSSHEIIELKAKNTIVHEQEDVPVFTYSGDAKIEFLNSQPWVRKSKILAMEVTYMGDKKTIDNAREWGHIHLDELVDVIDDIESENILLVHLSARFKISELIREIQLRFKKSDAERILVFPRQFKG